MIESVLIVNRGEIAVRIIRACRELGIRSILAHSPSDAATVAARLTDDRFELPGDLPAEGYLNLEAIATGIRATEAAAVHPGYGFLSENGDLARLVDDLGRVFIGPQAHVIDRMGSKIAARCAAEEAGVPCAPGSVGVTEAAEAARFGKEHGYPLAIKASFGGGGRGMRVVRDPAEIEDALAGARREAGAYFGNGEVYLERYLDRARHVEVQILADQHGTVVWLGDRDCSVQRRHQKLIEESPAPGLTPEFRRRMGEAAAALARHVGYTNAGTVEFLVQGDDFYFLEMNTRLQVEHPVTEAVTGIDIVREQLRVASGERLGTNQAQVGYRGHAIELRINAEDPAGGKFLPAPGPLRTLELSSGPGIRVDSGYESGDTVSERYDSLIAKVVVWDVDRPSCIRRARSALEELRVIGVPTTAAAHRVVLEHPDFQEMKHHTHWLEESGVVEDLPVEVEAAAHEAEEPAPTDRSIVHVGGRTLWIPTFGDSAVGLGRAPGDAPAVSALRAAGPRRSSGAAAGADGLVRAPMQGTVVRLKVAVGDEVAAGDVVALLEAMKMENELRAGRAGVVSSISTQVGASVGPGDVVVTIE